MKIVQTKNVIPYLGELRRRLARREQGRHVGRLGSRRSGDEDNESKDCLHGAFG